MTTAWCWNVLVALLLWTVRTVGACQPVEVAACRDLPYNLTSSPNLAGNEDQAEAELQLASFKPLLQLRCSSDLHFFLCSVYVPMCPEKVEASIGPCRPLCESVRECCEPMLRQFGFNWPAVFECARFPAENNARSMCMKGPGDGSCRRRGIADAPLAETSSSSAHPRPASPRRVQFVNESGVFLPLCHVEALFNRTQMDVGWALALVLAALCFFTAGGVHLAHQLQSDTNANVLGSAQEGPLFYISLCYALSTFGHAVRLVSGWEAAACVHYGPGGQLVLVGGGLHQVLCAVVAVFNCYFSSAGRLWWLASCVIWSAERRFPNSANVLDRRRFYVHLFVWLAPLLQTTALLAERAADADPLTGLCSAGNLDKANALRYALLPELLCLTLGATALVAGCWPDRRSVESFKTDGTGSWILLAMYLGPGTCQLICHFYVYRGVATWLRPDYPSSPSFGVFLLRVLSTHIYGLLTGGWLIRGKMRTARRNSSAPKPKGAILNSEKSPFIGQHLTDLRQSTPVNRPPSPDPCRGCDTVI